MAKRKVFCHIGLGDGSGDIIEAALGRHAHALAALGVRCPARSPEEMFRAVLEMRRQHQQWGYRRHEVEGAWTTICRRGREGRDTLVVSQPLLAGAESPQIELLFDGLAGFERHVVITVATPDAWTLPGDTERDLGTVVARWGAAVRKPERLHVLVADESRDPARIWKAFGRTVGFGTASLAVDDLPASPGALPVHPVPVERLAMLQAVGRDWVEQLTDSGHDVVGDLQDLVPAASHRPDHRQTDRELAESARHVERLTRRNQMLERRVADLEAQLAPRRRGRRLDPVA